MANEKQTKILIVDDDQDLREVIAIDFENLGYITSMAENGLLALGMIEKENFDVVVTDLRMPTLGGLGLYKKIIEMNLPKIPITIFITGFSDVNIVDALDLGVADYIEKPFSRRNLISSVQWHLKPKALKWGDSQEIQRIEKESKNIIKQDFKNLVQARKEGLLKVGRGGFLMTLDNLEITPAVGMVFKFEILFSTSGENPWLGYGRIRWSNMGQTTSLGVEVLNFQAESLQSFLNLQTELNPKSYIPKF